MQSRTLGGQPVSEIGLGCMSLSHAYGVPPIRERAMTVVRRAIELGVSHLDTAALYGFGANEELLGEILPEFRSRIHLASKCGMTGVDGRRVIDGRPETLRRTLDESLRRCRTDVIDLYYLHRLDRSVPLEDSIGALAQMVEVGKIRSIGLSEVSVETLRRAHALHPVAAVQSEYSLWTREPELGVLEECRRSGTAFVAFSPLGRGFLAGSVTDPSQLPERDLRRSMPRFQEPHWTRNLALLGQWRTLAAETGHEPAQLALAWLLHKAPHIIPIPGTTSIAHLEQNIAAAAVRLDDALFARIGSLVDTRAVSGPRYPAATLAEIDAERFPTP